MLAARLSLLLVLAFIPALALAAPVPAPALPTVIHKGPRPIGISGPPLPKLGPFRGSPALPREDVDLNDPEVLKKLGLPRLN
ncbi:hypothetical protein EVG20_g5160 [Dentipellis fragilis]|uniref:Uncharacterized protein n=1 Tax=Dentipellis fragilis TaxID=205917 RepID=A0A4Y9YU51_9AGAM|nr:hypothetical protein EVG20_g5160 [Dentipellis fragilis]